MLPLPCEYCSLTSNKIGDQGAAALGYGLKTNATLTELEYVAV